MPRRKSETPTDAELRIMEVLWSHGPATVAMIQRALAKHKLAYTTLLTTVQVLEQKGYVSHSIKGRAYVYSARVEQKDSRRKAVRALLSRWFASSPNALLLNLLDETELRPEELDELIRRAKRKKK